MKRFTIPVVVLLFAAGLGTPAEAAATPISIACGSDPGVTINSPGSYRLTTAVSNCGASPAIRIDASNVTLNLGGNIVDGDDGGSHGILVNGNRVTIKNGTIANFQQGVRINGNAGKVTGITATSCLFDGISFQGNDNVAQNNILIDNGDAGIFTSTFAVVQDNVVTGGGVGINAQADSRVTGNRISGATVGIFSTLGGGNKIVGNTVTGSTGTGISVNFSNLVRGNRVTGSGDSGIHAANGNRIVSNVVKSNSGNGITTTGTGNTIRKNTSNANRGDGIDTPNDDATTISRNTTKGNGVLGVDAGPLVGGGNNTARNNGTAAQCEPASLC